MTTATLTRTDREIQADGNWTRFTLVKNIGGIVCQTPTSDKTREPDASALECGSELDEQIFRLQCLVSHLLEKNEELRQRLARQALGKEGPRFIGQRSGAH